MLTMQNKTYNLPTLQGNRVKTTIVDNDKTYVITNNMFQIIQAHTAPVLNINKHRKGVEL